MSDDTAQVMSEEESRYFNENVPYDRGQRDGVTGNKKSTYEAHNPWYVRGFEMGRKRLRDNYQRALLNDYGRVDEEA